MGTYLRFELAKATEGSGRVAGKQAHDERFEKIWQTLLSVELKTLYDKFRLYGRGEEGVYLLSTEGQRLSEAYRRQLEKEWSAEITREHEQTIINVAAMKVARNAPEDEVMAFLKEMKYSYGLTQTEQRAKLQLRRERRPKL